MVLILLADLCYCFFRLSCDINSEGWHDIGVRLSCDIFKDDVRDR